MTKTALWKDTFREIWETKTRFLSIFAIILLGVAFFAGISATGPVMIETSQSYYNDHALMDLQVMSTMGLNDEDIHLIDELEDVSTEVLYALDVVFEDTGDTSKVFGYVPEEQQVNQYIVQEGRLPNQSGEIALDATINYRENYAIGDMIAFEEETGDEFEEHFHVTEFEVVGFVSSPLYVENINRGNTQVGAGTLNGFSVILEEDFDMEYRTEAYIRFNESDALPAYSEEYNRFVDEKVQEIESLFESRPEERLEELRQEIGEDIDQGREEIEEARVELAEAEQDLADARLELDEGWADYEAGLAELEAEESNARAQIDEQRLEIEDGRRALEAGRAALQEAQNEVDAGWAELQSEMDGTDFEALEQELAEGRSQLESTRLELEANQATINIQRQELENARQMAEEAGVELGPEFRQAEAELIQTQEELAAGEAEINAQEEALLAGEQELEAGRAQIAQAQQELVTAQAEINAGWSELEEQEAFLESGEQALNDAETELEASLETARLELEEGLVELEEGEAEYASGLAEFEEEQANALAEIEEAELELDEAEEELADLDAPEYIVNDRVYFQGYEEYGENAERIQSLATIFPVFFFLLAALISLTTMTRMVDEGRNQIGTMKALGYSNKDISMKFFTYAFIATVLGGAIGLVIGYAVFPRVIMDAYGTMFNIPTPRFHFFWSYALISFVGALFATGLSTLASVRSLLRNNSATLLRPKAPKKGKRIFLEYMPFLWNRFTFTQKVASRNLFRYKRRMFMTIFGISGCTALLLTGFGLSDSIADIGELQFGEINQYQAIIIEQEEPSENQQQSYEETLDELTEIEDQLSVHQENATAIQNGRTQDITLLVAEDPERMEDFVVLRDKDNESQVHDLPDEGIILTEKLSQLYDLEVGDHLTIEDSENQSFEVEVAGIVEHYVQHYAYFSPQAYENAVGEEAVFSSRMLKYNPEAVDDDEIGQILTNEEAVQGVMFMTLLSDTLESSMDSLNVVTIVLVVSAAALAIVVLYNLTNINVSERIRELSTIKVLGFYNREVTMYVYRENVILTLMGIIVGLILGVFMHSFVLDTAEMDQMMFSRMIRLTSYVYASAMTFLFSAIVMAIMHVKLKNVDMIEALKTQD